MTTQQIKEGMAHDLGMEVSDLDDACFFSPGSVPIAKVKAALHAMNFQVTKKHQGIYVGIVRPADFFKAVAIVRQLTNEYGKEVYLARVKDASPNKEWYQKATGYKVGSTE